MISINDAFKLGLRMALISALAAAIAIVALPAASRAQSLAPDTFSVNYYSFNVYPAPVATVRIINPTGGPRCAYLYVFDARQNLKSCCSCGISSNGLLTLPLRPNLLKPDASGEITATGAIKLVSSSPTATTALGCDIKVPPNPTPALRAWATHVQIGSGPQFQLTEDEFLDSPLDGVEFEKLIGQCSAAGANVNTCNCGSASTLP
jgi:hypothetical protein